MNESLPAGAGTGGSAASSCSVRRRRWARWAAAATTCSRTSTRRRRSGPAAPPRRHSGMYSAAPFGVLALIPAAGLQRRLAGCRAADRRVVAWLRGLCRLRRRAPQPRRPRPRGAAAGRLGPGHQETQPGASAASAGGAAWWVTAECAGGRAAADGPACQYGTAAQGDAPSPRAYRIGPARLPARMST